MGFFALLGGCAAAGDALFGLMPADLAAWKLPAEFAAIGLLTLLLVVFTYLFAVDSFTHFLSPNPEEVASYFRAAALPADRIMVETDAPYLAPLPYRGKRNEPAYVVETAKVLADARGVSADEIARQTTENFFQLFSKVPRVLADAA